MELVLETNRLTKAYKKQIVVNGVSLSVAKGDIYGFVGKNGAGKTTFMRMILGHIKPDSGTFTLLSDSDVRAARKRVGSLVESPALYTNMSALENVRLCCTILGEDKKQSEAILETVGLADTGKKKAGNFSLGMKQRLGIALALVGNPEFLMLDEPINGLDPTGIVEIRNLLLELKNQGKTIFISSHILGELEKIATRYGIISKGKLVEEITAAELAEKCSSRTVIQTDDSKKAAQILRKHFPELDSEIDNSSSIIVTGQISNIGELTNILFQNNITVAGINSSDSSAENYFIKKMEEG